MYLTSIQLSVLSSLVAQSLMTDQAISIKHLPVISGEGLAQLIEYGLVKSIPCTEQKQLCLVSTNKGIQFIRQCLNLKVLP